MVIFENYEDENKQIYTTPQQKLYSWPWMHRQWLAKLLDYIAGSTNDSSNEEIINFVLFVYCELVTFEDASNEIN